MIEIRKETPADYAAVRRLNEIAFENGPEAALVDKLRTVCDRYVAFVAVDDGEVVGHVLFTPATLDGSDAVGMGLAPMAVLPSRQGEGIGSQLVRHGLAHLKRARCPYVIVLGHPAYYPRFGFEPASHFRLESQWPGVPAEAFMIAVFDRSALPKDRAVARYRPEFDEAM